MASARALGFGRVDRAAREGPLWVRPVGAQRRVRVAVLGEAASARRALRRVRGGAAGRGIRGGGARDRGLVLRSGRRCLVPRGQSARARDRREPGGHLGGGRRGVRSVCPASPSTGSRRAPRCSRGRRSPQFGGGAIVGPTATVQPARLAFGLRAKLLSRGVRIFENSPVVRVRDGAGVDVAGGGSVRAPSVVVAVNHVAGGLRPWRRLVSSASSHIVLTAPIAGLSSRRSAGPTATALRDCRTMLHYFRTTNDGRIAFGWGGGRMALGSRRRPRARCRPRRGRARRGVAQAVLPVAA